MAVLVVDVHLRAVVRHGVDDGLRVEEPAEAAGDRQRRSVCLSAALWMFTPQHCFYFCSRMQKFSHILHLGCCFYRTRVSTLFSGEFKRIFF